jgi:hypothetical protein
MVMSFKGEVFLLKGLTDSGLVWTARARQLDSANNVTRIFRAMLLVRKQRFAEARQLVQGLWSPLEPYTLYVLAATGDTAEVQKRLATLAAPGNRFATPWTTRGYAFLGLGDTTRALDALTHATDRHEVWPNISPVGLPVFDAVRNSQRFRALRTRVGLPAQ